MTTSYFAWCLSWEDAEDSATEIRPYDVASGVPVETPNVLNVAFYNLDNAREAAEIYADYVHAKRGGWEATWPLTFRVRCPSGTIVDVEVDRETVPSFHGRVINRTTS